MSDNNTQLYLLIGSVAMNSILIIKDCVHRMRSSDCCGARINFVTRKVSEVNMKKTNSSESDEKV